MTEPLTEPLTGAMIAALSAAAIPVVTNLVNLLKPFVELLPWADPRNPADKATHDASLQLLNGLITAGSVAALAIIFGYVTSPASFWLVGVQIIGVMLGADFTYRSSNASGTSAAAPAAVLPSAPAVASGLTAAIVAAEAAPVASPVASPAVPAPAAPLHQQAAPAEPAVADDAIEDDGAPTQPILRAVAAPASPSAAPASAI